MNENIKNLKGSPKRDTFKRAHKELPGSYTASDCDLCLIEFNYKGVVAYLDYKGSGEGITDTEKILYDEWSKTKPVYIEGSDPENGPFIVRKYIPNSYRTKYICELDDWKEFKKWESEVRKNYRSEQRRNSMRR